MVTVQVVLDQKLLKAADRAARRTKQNRSALVRDALRDHLQRLEIRAKEEQERAGYAKYPQTKEEIELWQGEAAWLEE